MVLLVFAVLNPSFVWVAGLTLGIALSCLLVQAILYRPPENHIGVIYQAGRFWRFVGPNEWAILIPRIHEAMTPISLNIQRVDLTFSDLLTRDLMPLTCEFVAYFLLDLRKARTDFLIQALHIPKEGWNSIIETVLREVANEVVASIDLQQLLTPQGRNWLKARLSEQLAERVESLGLLVNPRTGVTVQALRPTKAVSRAVVDRFVATLLGDAALDRVRPIVERLCGDGSGVAWEALLLEWASAVVQQGAPPQVMIASTDRLGTDRHVRDTLPVHLQAVSDTEASAATRKKKRADLSDDRDKEAA